MRSSIHLLNFLSFFLLMCLLFGEYGCGVFWVLWLEMSPFLSFCSLTGTVWLYLLLLWTHWSRKGSPHSP